MARSPAHLREPPGDEGRRPLHDPGAHGPQEPGDDPALRPPLAPAPCPGNPALEPSTNRHHYRHRAGGRRGRHGTRRASPHAAKEISVRPDGIEPPTYRFED